MNKNLQKLLTNQKEKRMFEEQAFVQILKEFTIIKKCLEVERSRSTIQYLKGRLAGIEFCMSKIGYGFYFEEDKWIIKRKPD